MEKTVSEEIEVYRFQGKAEGPRLMMSGAVHGNEKAGPKALRRLIGLIEAGEIEIEKGALTIVPVCNPRAYEQDVRFTEYNLNRSMYPRAENEIQYYEDRLRGVLCPLLEDTDYLLDIHSCTAKSEPFIILGGDLSNPANIDFVKATKVPNILFGWEEAVGASEDLPDPRHTMGMTEYARSHGAIAATVECGNHSHERGPDFAFEAALNILAHVLDVNVPPALHVKDVFGAAQQTIRFERVVFKTAEGTFEQDWANLQPVHANTKIGAFENGVEVVMPFDGYLIMPKEKAEVGAEWMYFGEAANV